jgi:putative transposase
LGRFGCTQPSLIGLVPLQARAGDESAHLLTQAVTARAKAAIKEDAVKAIDLFTRTHDPKDPDAPLCKQNGREKLIIFIGVPVQSCQSIRTRNPVEAACAANPSSHQARPVTQRTMLLMLAQCDVQNGRKLRDLDCLAKVISGAAFKDGMETTKPNQIAA